MKIKIIGILFSLFCLLTHPAGAEALNPELDILLRKAGTDRKIPVIVRFVDTGKHLKFSGDDSITQLDGQYRIRKKDRPEGPALILKKDRKNQRMHHIRSLRQNQRLAGSAIAKHLPADALSSARDLWAINAVALRADAKLIDALSRHPAVQRIDPDGMVQMPETVTTGQAIGRWNLNMIGAPDLWDQGYTGEAIVVAIMDSGVDGDHPDLSGRWRGGANSWYDPYGIYEFPHDTRGHGTQVAGIIVGGDASGEAIGIAPGAKWIAVRIYDDDGVAFYSTIHSGFQWLLDPDGDPDTNDAPDVVNNSWALTTALNTCVDEFQEDIDLLREAGIAVIFAAGNTGPNPATSISPSNYETSISVGAVDSQDQVTNFSGRGPSACSGDIYPTVTAPGEFILTADLTLGNIGQPYAEVFGTSFAAAHVTGGLALLMNAFPDAELIDLKQALEDSAEDLGDSGPDNDYGHGRIHLPSALEILRTRSEAGSGGDGGGCFVSEIAPDGRQ